MGPQDERIRAKDGDFGIKRILAPVDFSEASLVGLDYAIAIGERFNAEVVVVFAVEPLRYAGDRQLLLADEQRFGRRELSRLERRLRERGLMHRTVLQVGTPYQVIVEEARKCGADLIVMATHGRTGLSHLLLGSVAEKVIRTARCPVLTVPAPSSGPSSVKEGQGLRRR
jgi:nucleotide-binding universal stress UspA family protein